MNYLQILILTKSSKNGGKCVAGICLQDGEWIRLVSDDKTTHGAIPNWYLRYADGNMCNVFDVVEAPILGKCDDILQPENVLVDTDSVLKFIRRGTLEETIKNFGVDNRQYLLGNAYSYVTERKIKDVGYSLTLVEVYNLVIHQVEIDGKPKTKVDFTYNNITYCSISVTDPAFYEVRDNTRYSKAYLVVSIGTPYNGERYYKFVASVFI